VVVSSHQLIREAVSGALASRGIDVQAVALPAGAADYHELRRSVSAANGDLGLLVIDVENVVQLRNAAAVMNASELPWIVLTNAYRGPIWGALLAAGACDVLSTSSTVNDVAATVRVVAERGARARAADYRELIEEWWQVADQARELTMRLERLSAREMEVLSELAHGDPVRSIAQRVGVAEGTVRSQLRSIFRKLGVRSQLQAVAAFRSVNDWLKA
jgi:DNA-binding NarL/FixJ family response regulator